MNYAIILTNNNLEKKTLNPTHLLLGKPMIEYLVDTLEAIDIESILYIGQNSKDLVHLLKDRVNCIETKTTNTQMNAIKSAKDYIKGDGYTLIIPDTIPLIDQKMLNEFVMEHSRKQYDFTIGSVKVNQPKGWKRIIRNRGHEIVKIIGESECSEAQKFIKEIDTEIYCLHNQFLSSALSNININKESLTGFIETYFENVKIGVHEFQYTYKLKRIYDLFTLSTAEDELRKEIIKKHLANGVYVINTAATTIGYNVQIGKGSTIYPGCYIVGKSMIGRNCTIGPNTELMNAVIKDNVICTHSVVYDTVISSDAKVGPFTHLRMNTFIGKNNRIGNFVEIKQSYIGDKTNIAHLSYIGDTTCGTEVNWGCGCVTVNYDGKEKFKTEVGNRVFIGCNTNLIAPIKIDNDSYIAAGSTITEDLKSGDFAIARAKQIIKRDYASKYNYKKIKD